MSLTVAVIGCGNISKYHFASLEKIGARVKWVCDLSLEQAQPWIDKLGAEFSVDYRDALADAAVDLVVITPVSSVHKVMCCDAIAAGKAVVCEKTLAENAEDAYQIVSAAAEAGTPFYTSYMKRFIPAVQKAKELLPEIGPILSTYIRAHQCWGDLWSNSPSEGVCQMPSSGPSEIRKKYGGGILVCGGSHILDLVLFFLGRPRSLYAHMHTPEGRDYDLQAACLMETDNGVVHFEALAHGLGNVGFLEDGWDERMEINGVHGRLEVLSAAWDQFETKSSRLVYHRSGAETPEVYDFDPVSPFERAMTAFSADIENGHQDVQSRLTGYEVDELIAHIKLSAEQGKAVDIGWRC